MRSRNIRLQVWVNEKELAMLDRKAQRSRLTRAAYIRQLIRGYIPRDAPPPDYYAMMKELYRIGNNLNQIAQKAHVLNVIDVQRYDAGVRQFEEAVRTITKATILPRRMSEEDVPSTLPGPGHKTP